jgi:Polyketide cyclase / dehydrase and lipid transport
MATIRSEIRTLARSSEVWAAVRDIGALHTRLVPGFVTDTKLEPGARVVTFVNGVTLREPIVAVDDETRRLVWTHEGGRARHYNGALEVSELADGSTSVVWTADFLPDDIGGYLRQAIDAGMAAMQRSLDRLAA